MRGVMGEEVEVRVGGSLHWAETLHCFSFLL